MLKEKWGRLRRSAVAIGLIAALATPVVVLPANPANAASTVVCVGDGVSGRRVQLVYVRPTGGTNRYPEMDPKIQDWATKIDAAYLEAAQRGGGVRHVIFVHSVACNPIVAYVEVPASEINNPEKVAAAMKARGYNRTDRIYLTFYQGTHECGLGWNDAGGSDSPSSGSPYNSGPGWAMIDEGCWAWNNAGHELLHAMGAVQASAPHATAFGHCWDDQDILCYDDGGLPSGGLKNECPSAVGDIIDCNNDDYFNYAPAAGTYLASHWNVANSYYLTGFGPGAPVYTGTKTVATARAGANAYVTKYQLPDGRWTLKAKVVTNTSSPFYSAVLAVRTPSGVRYIPPSGVPRGSAEYVTVEANTSVEVKLCEGNAAAKGGCTATWW
ncbi:hypothetical protein [Micromonospora sp. NPDC049359]|uniref:hypothetical protein n=1 Tax=Micromonospora sp. NPDC049359 TaxID=3364270 RepID=UPI0037A20C2A